MQINVCIIEAGGVVEAIPQKYIKLSIYCNIPEAIACLDLNGQNISFKGHLK